MKANRPSVYVAALGLSCCLLGLFGGCVTQTAYTAVANRIPPPDPGYARVYLYSDNFMQQARATSCGVSFDGKPEIDLGSFQVLYVDHPQGSLKIKACLRGVWPTGEEEIVLELAPGETRYVQLGTQGNGNHIGCHCHFVLLADPSQAMRDIVKCWYVGPSLPNPSKG